MGIEPVSSLQALIFATMFSAVVSMPEEVILLEFGVSQKDLVDNFQMGTETALGRANIIRTTKIETLQAFVMYMVGQFCIAPGIFKSPLKLTRRGGLLHLYMFLLAILLITAMSILHFKSIYRL